MPDQDSNKLPDTNYLLKNINNALYLDNGNVTMRTSIGGDSVTITGNVSIPGIVTVTNTDDYPLFTHTHLYDESDDEYTDSNPFTIDGTVALDAASTGTNTDILYKFGWEELSN